MFFAGLLMAVSPWFALLVLPGALLARRFLLLGAVVFAAGFLRVAMSPPVPAPLPPLDTVITARIVSTPTLSPKWQRATLDAGDRYLLLYTPPDRDLRAGDVIRFEGKPRTLEGDSANYWYRRGIRQSVTLFYDGAIEVVEPGGGLRTIGSTWRRDLLGRLEANLPSDVAAVAMGIVAGQQDIVPDWITDDMTRSGTLHLLATSGFNVLLLAGALLFVAAHTPLPRVIQIALVILMLIIYADAVGGRAPVTRATVMAVVFFSAIFFGRTSDGLSAMALAAIGTALFEPWSILDAGYQLSFLVVFGLMLYAPPAFRKVQSFVSKRSCPGPIKVVAVAIGTSLSTTLVAMLFASPILSSRFGTFSIVAPIANLITAAAVPFVYLGVAVGSIGDLLSSSIGRGADLLITGPSSAAIIRANHSLAAWPGSSVSGVYLPAWAMVCIYILLLALSRQQKPAELLDEEF